MKSSTVLNILSKKIVWLFIFIGAVWAAFSWYSKYLVEYSMNDLESALSFAKKNPEDISALDEGMYHNLISDMLVEEISREKTDTEAVLLLDKAADAARDSVERFGLERLAVYLQSLKESRSAQRKPIARTLDRIFLKIRQWLESITNFLRYLMRHITPTAGTASAIYDYKSILLIKKAEDHENKYRFAQAETIYRECLNHELGFSEKGFVQIALANALLKQNKLEEAGEILKGVRFSYAGKEQARVAIRMMERVKKITDRLSKIAGLQEKMEAVDMPLEVKEKIEFQLALSYISIYQLDSARKILEELSSAKDPNIQKKSLFYLGWMMKTAGDVESGKRHLQELLEDPQLESDLEIMSRSQMASIYQQTNEVEKALKEYQIIQQQVEITYDSEKARKKALLALSEMEQASLYGFDLKNAEQASKHLKRLEALETIPDSFHLESKFEKEKSQNLRDLGFNYLQKGDIYSAYDLFQRYLAKEPNDAWAHGGIATLQILFGDSKKALEFAKKANEITDDEYSASVLAYVYSLMGRYQEAAEHYGRAISKNPDYIPAQFNLACVYLEIKKYDQALKLLEILYASSGNRSVILRSKILNNRGVAHWYLGSTDRSLDDFTEALKLNPDLQAAKDNLERIAKGQSPQADTKTGR